MEETSVCPYVSACEHRAFGIVCGMQNVFRRVSLNGSARARRAFFIASATENFTIGQDFSVTAFPAKKVTAFRGKRI